MPRRHEQSDEYAVMAKLQQVWNSHITFQVEITLSARVFTFQIFCVMFSNYGL